MIGAGIFRHNPKRFDSAHRGWAEMRRLRSGRTDRRGEKNRHTHIVHNGRDNSIRKLAMRQPDADEAGPGHCNHHDKRWLALPDLVMRPGTTRY